MQPFLVTNDTEEKWKRRKASFNVPVNAITVVKLPRKRQSRDEGNTGTGKRFSEPRTAFCYQTSVSSFSFFNTVKKDCEKCRINLQWTVFSTLEIVTETKILKIWDEEFRRDISGKEEILNFQGEFICASFPFVVFLYKYKHDFIPLTLFFSSCLNIF